MASYGDVSELEKGLSNSPTFSDSTLKGTPTGSTDTETKCAEKAGLLTLRKRQHPKQLVQVLSFASQIQDIGHNSSFRINQTPMENCRS